jgi:hypothetical protein
MTRSPLSPAAHMSSAVALVGAVALAFTGLLATASPAQAQGASTDYRCTGLVEQARTAAAGADAKKQASATRLVSTGVKLCEAGNERAAAKQFRAALKIAGVAEAAPADARLAAR